MLTVFGYLACVNVVARGKVALLTLSAPKYARSDGLEDRAQVAELHKPRSRSTD